MNKWNEIVSNEKLITEISWPKAINFHEMCLFYRIATPEQEEELENALKEENFDGVIEILKRVVGEL